MEFLGPNTLIPVDNSSEGPGTPALQRADDQERPIDSAILVRVCMRDGEFPGTFKKVPRHGRRCTSYGMFEMYRPLCYRAACRFCNFRLLNTNSSGLGAYRRDAPNAPNFVFSRRKLQNRQAATSQTYGISESPGACQSQYRFVVPVYNNSY